MAWVETMKQTLKKIARKFPVIRGLTRETTPYLCGSVLENRLGYQVLRMATRRLSPLVRHKSFQFANADQLETLDRDGILTVPNYLEAEAFAKLRQEVEQLTPRMQFRPLRGSGAGRMDHAQLNLNDLELSACPELGALIKDPLLKELAAAVMPKDTIRDPSIFIDFFKRSEFADQPDNDIEAFLHSDLHLPTAKAWLLLEPVTLDNGPFMYAKGSHKLSSERYRHEYEMSVLSARLRQGSLPADHPKLGSAGPHRRIVLKDADYARLGIEETPITGEANTLIVTNTFGFHRRGSFKPGTIRKWILLNFRKYNRGWS